MSIVFILKNTIFETMASATALVAVLVVLLLVIGFLFDYINFAELIIAAIVTTVIIVVLSRVVHFH